MGKNRTTKAPAGKKAFEGLQQQKITLACKSFHCTTKTLHQGSALFCPQKRRCAAVSLLWAEKADHTAEANPAGFHGFQIWADHTAEARRSTGWVLDRDHASSFPVLNSRIHETFFRLRAAISRESASRRLSSINYDSSGLVSHLELKHRGGAEGLQQKFCWRNVRDSRYYTRHGMGL